MDACETLREDGLDPTGSGVRASLFTSERMDRILLLAVHGVLPCPRSLDDRLSFGVPSCSGLQEVPECVPGVSLSNETTGPLFAPHP